MMTMMMFQVILLACTTWGVVVGQNYDLFNYDMQNKNEYGITSRGQPQWNKVRCGNAETCVSSQTKCLDGIPHSHWGWRASHDKQHSNK